MIVELLAFTAGVLFGFFLLPVSVYLLHRDARSIRQSWDDAVPEEYA